MILKSPRLPVINNIKTAVSQQQFNQKVEVGDPKLSNNQAKELINSFETRHNSLLFRFNTSIARTISSSLTYYYNRNTDISGLEKIKSITGGAIVTSNHFSPIENTAIRKVIDHSNMHRLYVVSQLTNLAMPGFLGYMMNYDDLIPISSDIHYMGHDFESMMDDILSKGHPILIYPEQEMWFNYRKPRPPMRGAYYYAAKFNVPIISCFVEIIDTNKADEQNFNMTRFHVHVLDPIYPDQKLSVRENSIAMMNHDFEQKKQAYERIYHQKLTYQFRPTDIAGWQANKM